jgi:hypothetical protein
VRPLAGPADPATAKRDLIEAPADQPQPQFWGGGPAWPQPPPPGYSPLPVWCARLRRAPWRRPCQARQGPGLWFCILTVLHFDPVGHATAGPECCSASQVTCSVRLGCLCLEKELLPSASHFRPLPEAADAEHQRPCRLSDLVQSRTLGSQRLGLPLLPLSAHATRPDSAQMPRRGAGAQPPPAQQQPEHAVAGSGAPPLPQPNGFGGLAGAGAAPAPGAGAGASPGSGAPAASADGAHAQNGQPGPRQGPEQPPQPPPHYAGAPTYPYGGRGYPYGGWPEQPGYLGIAEQHWGHPNGPTPQQYYNARAAQGGAP